MSDAVLERERTRRRWHPATEIIILVCALLLVFGVPSPLVPLVIIALALGAAVVSPAVRFSSWMIGVGVLCLPTLIVVGVVQGLFYPGAEAHVLWELGPARLTVEGLSIAVQIWLRVSALVSLCALFGLGADSARMFDGLRALRMPVSVAYVCASAIGLIPLLRTRTRQAIESRAARGWPVDRWSVRIRLLPAIVAGLFTSVLIEVEQRHEVLQQRGLEDSGPRVSLQDHNDDGVQKIIRRGAPVLTLLLIAASVAGVLPLPDAAVLIGGE
ncbi:MULTISPECIES: energy-coupling factor transporter transmembrane component T [unclassified Brevibacterium]|uniref:energy-coupling factor transporter transmembrane component T family protein n=1 Tax=unclassified Brevibacterium TaxID=2614124 RepID=UPI001E3D8BC6|nr:MULTISPECIES: energy-coupling factor transporter transmembrane component T [unclassified Brevibacterium]MCD1284511.1 energy-coupling factor transporter transmembrane protein EcfT [Brevibacterium sp. CCUG 69071]MDK8435871.1 energy-coupling factor transporter transmembrane component T [Brevibacterium sp. H-BE7]